MDNFQLWQIPCCLMSFTDTHVLNNGHNPESNTERSTLKSQGETGLSFFVDLVCSVFFCLSVQLIGCIVEISLFLNQNIYFEYSRNGFGRE